MSLNSDKSDNSSSSLQTSSSSSSNNLAKDNKQQENIYQNIPLNNSNYENEIPLADKQWPNDNLILEYSAEPKVLVPNKRTTSLAQQSHQNYSSNNQQNKNQKSSTQQQQSTQSNIQHQQIQNNNINQPLQTSSQIHKLTNENQQQQQQQLFNNQQQTIQQQAIINQQSNQLLQQPKLNLMQSIPVQRMPNGNIYLSIDRRTLPHQIKMVPTQIGQIRPPPYDLTKTNNANAAANLLLQQQQQAQLKQTATLVPHFHLITENKNQINNNQTLNVQAQQQQNNKQPTTNQKTDNKSQQQQQISQFYQTLPLRFATNAKQIIRTTADPSKCCQNQPVLTNNGQQLPQQQGKPQLILIHSYNSNNGNLANAQNGATISNLGQLASLGNQKAIAIKIHHPAQPGDKGNPGKVTETSALLTANGKIITTLQPNGTLLNSNLVNSNALLQQALLRGTLNLKDSSTSNFPNPSEIRRRDGINAPPLQSNWNEQKQQQPQQQQTKQPTVNQADKQQKTGNVKDELESFVQQDLQRTEKIKKKYSVSDDEDPTFGFGRRPSVKGIKACNPGFKFSGSTSDLIKQAQLSLSNNQNKSNMIQLTGNKASTLQRPNSQVILTSQLSTDKLNQSAAVVNGQPINLSTAQAIPLIQKAGTQNNQRHVYLIQNSIANNFQQQRIVQAGATLPRNGNISLSAINNAANQQQLPHIQLASSPQQTNNGGLIKAFISQQQSVSNNNLQALTNLNPAHPVDSKSPAANTATAAGVHLLSGPAINNSGQQQRPSSSLGENKDNQLKTNQTVINLNNSNLNLEQANKVTQQQQQQQILYYHKIGLATPNQAMNLGQVQDASTLQYKTISMPNVTLIKSGQQLINIAPLVQNQQMNTQQLNSQQQQAQQKLQQHSPNKHPAVILNNAQTVNTIQQQKQQQQKQIQAKPTSINASINSSKITKQTGSVNSSANSTSNNNQQPNTNNSNLVKDGTHLMKTDDKTAKLKQVNNKDEMIFYSMNV